MGGNAFPTLEVPRLSHEEYQTVRTKCISILQQFYEQVVSPPEAPDKPDHGDVDILVSIARGGAVVNIEEIETKFGAIQRTKMGVTTSFAVPHPTKKSYAQVDVHVCKEGCLAWELWMGGYGDLVQIIGMLNRSIGLTMTDKGLFVRVPEIEPTRPKKSRLFLTCDSGAVMEFLGLDAEEYKGGYQSLEQVFRWCAAGKYYGHQRRSRSDTEEDVQTSPSKSDDRKRLRKRPMFAQFVLDWSPSHPEAYKNEVPVERTQVLRAAVEHFKVEKEYKEMLHQWQSEQNEIDTLNAIRETIPLETRSRTTLLGIKRWTRFQNGIPYLRDEDDPVDPSSAKIWLQKLSGESRKNFLNWVALNHTECRKREKGRIGN